MKTILFLRGVPCSGKSTWVKENNLQDYTISLDSLRLLFKSPEILPNGKLNNNFQEDILYKYFFELIENRMKSNCFIVIDTTNVNYKQTLECEKLIKKYNYKSYIVDFTSVPLKVCLDRLEKRNYYLNPQNIVDKFNKIDKVGLPKFIDGVLQPNELYKINLSYVNLDQYEKIHVIGDIHGCCSVLTEYLNHEHLKENEFYIFLGDYLDRGIENVSIIKTLFCIYRLPNVILLKGNHEIHLEKYSQNLLSYSKEFNNITAKELDAAEIPKKRISKLLKTMKDIFLFEYNNQKYICTHGGILPNLKLPLINDEQLIKGIGDYSTDIDKLFTQRSKDLIQIHGHRNLYNKPIHASEKSYNLEGQVELGKFLRAIQITKKGIKEFLIKNNVYYKTPLQNSTIKSFVINLKKHPLITECILDNNVSSFNFSRKAFYQQNWDDLNVKTRGLFINNKQTDIVARAYDKFFNMNEMEETKEENLKHTLQFPLKAYLKENGYLGITGYNKEFKLPFISSKSTNKGCFKNWFEKQLHITLGDKFEEFFEYLNYYNLSAVFEVIEPEYDPHIIKYSNPKIILLDFIFRNIEFSKVNDDKRIELAKYFGLETKKIVKTLYCWEEFINFRKQNENMKLEGFVFEDNCGFQFKLKSPYYNFWKLIRKIMEKIRSEEKGENKYLISLLEKYKENKDIIKIIKFLYKDNNIIKFNNVIDLQQYYYKYLK